MCSWNVRTRSFCKRRNLSFWSRQVMLKKMRLTTKRTSQVLYSVHYVFTDVLRTLLYVSNYNLLKIHEHSFAVLFINGWIIDCTLNITKNITYPNKSTHCLRKILILSLTTSNYEPNSKAHPPFLLLWKSASNE